MKPHHVENDSANSEVTTEPQRRALEAMSQELVEKLNIMVAEQEKRAREFTALQHSLSALPTAPQIPQLQPQETKPAPQSRPKLPPLPRKEPTPQPNSGRPSDSSFTQPSPRKELPSIPKYSPYDYTGEPHAPRRKPTVIKSDDNKQEEGIGIGTIITIVIIFFIVVAKGC